MKIIYPDKINSVSADEEDTEYPVANLTDNHPSKKWKATSYDAELTIEMQGGSDSISVIWTNAVSATVTISDAPSVVWDTDIVWDSGISWFTQTNSEEEETFTFSDDDDNSFVCNYTERTSVHTITIALSAYTMETLEAGIVSGGPITTFVDPHYGIQEGMNDHSILKMMSNGTFYYKKLDRARTFSGLLTLERDSDFYAFMLDLVKEIGPEPFVCQIVSSGSTDPEWTVYVSFQANMPQGVHHTPNYSQLSFQLTEVL
jgi:hypothetical protein